MMRTVYPEGYENRGRVEYRDLRREEMSMPLREVGSYESDVARLLGLGPG